MLVAYIAFQENLITRNSVGRGLGMPHNRKCDIPEGCPISMMFVSLIMVPCLRIMEEIGADPRNLPDDFFIMTHGDGHVSRFKSSMDATH